MKREKRLTKRERKALAPTRPGAAAGASRHIHCVACGRHIDQAEFGAPSTAKMLRCQHGSTFASCVECEHNAVALLEEHDRTGQAVKIASAWH